MPEERQSQVHMQQPYNETIDRLSQRAHRAVDKAADTMEAAQNRVKKSSEELKRQGQESAQKVEEHVNRHPLMSLGIAFVSGLVLASLLKR